MQPRLPCSSSDFCRSYPARAPRNSHLGCRATALSAASVSPLPLGRPAHRIVRSDAVLGLLCSSCIGDAVAESTRCGCKSRSLGAYGLIRPTRWFEGRPSCGSSSLQYCICPNRGQTSTPNCPSVVLALGSYWSCYHPGLFSGRPDRGLFTSSVREGADRLSCPYAARTGIRSCSGLYNEFHA